MFKESLSVCGGAHATTLGWHSAVRIAVFSLQDKRNLAAGVQETSVPLWCHLVWRKRSQDSQGIVSLKIIPKNACGGVK